MTQTERIARKYHNMSYVFEDGADYMLEESVNILKLNTLLGTSILKKNLEKQWRNKLWREQV